MDNNKKLTSQKKINIEEAIYFFEKDFLFFAKSLIEESQDLSKECNKRFFQNPNNYLEHEPRWHQWGIITHTKMFKKFNFIEAPQYFKKWGFAQKIDQEMSQLIDGISKKRLFPLVILFHDLGKFAARKLKYEKNGFRFFSFHKHAIASGEIIRSPKISNFLEKYGLTNLQIEYIAQCAELHYKLGDIREEGKKNKLKYNFNFIASDDFQKLAKKMMFCYSEFQLEMGILFLGDSLSKTDIRIQANSDQEVDSQSEAIQRKIIQRGLNPALIQSAKQLPVNCALVEAYLKIWAKKFKKGA